MRLRMRWLKVAALAASLVMFGAATPAWPQYPGKPVRVIVPFAAGGTPDVVGRIVSQQLAAQTGQAFVSRSGPVNSRQRSQPVPKRFVRPSTRRRDEETGRREGVTLFSDC